MPGSTVRERRRADAVARRIERRRTGLNTRNFHRNQRLVNIAFLVLVTVMTASATALLLV